MAELLVFTLLAAIAATYPILPKHRQLRVRYNLWTKGRLSFIGLMLGVIIATYWISILIQSKKQNSLSIDIFDWSVTITPLHVESAQLVAVLLIVLPITILFVKPSVRIRNEESLLEIIRSLYNREEYTTLVNLLQDNYRPLINHPLEPVHPESQTMANIVIAEADRGQNKDDKQEENECENRKDRNLIDENTEPDNTLRQALREVRQMLRNCQMGLQAKVNNWVKDWSERIQRKLRLFRYYGARLQYQAGNTAEDTSGYIETLLLDPDFTGLYSGLASELGFEILCDDSLESLPRQDIVHQYLRTQLRAENTLLYRNIEQNTAMDGLYRYKIEEENRLVYALFSDFERAEDLNVYKPIGDQTREIIREQRRKEFDEYHDQRLTEIRIRDDYIFRDPVFIGIQFFDVMVREAFNQEVDWHVWLSYYETFTREICRNYEITEYSDPNAEWPNDYSRFLYEIISNMRDWIRMLEEELESNTESGSNRESYTFGLDSDAGKSEAETLTDENGDLNDKSGDNEEQAEAQDQSDDNGKEQQGPAEVGNYLQIGEISTGRGERNIPEMTVIVLFSSHEEILTTDEIPIQFMGYITKIIFLCLLDLRKYNEGSLQWKYSELMLQCLGDNLSGRQSDPLYRENLERVYHGDYGDRYDYGVRHEVMVKDRSSSSLVEDLDEIIDQ